jgi:hypothetical protein
VLPVKALLKAWGDLYVDTLKELHLCERCVFFESTETVVKKEVVLFLLLGQKADSVCGGPSASN